MIILHITNIINGAVLAAFGRTDETIMYTFSCSYGMFLSPLFPTALVHANLYVEMTAVAVSVAYVGSAVGGMVYQYLVGALFDNYGEETLMYVILGYAVNLTLVYVLLQIWSSRHGKRQHKENKKSQMENHIQGKDGCYLKHTTEL